MTIDNKLSEVNAPKEEIYSKIQHRITETQKQNKKKNMGKTTKIVVNKDGQKVRIVTQNAQIMILYLSNLLLANQTSEALKSIELLGKYFHDLGLVEAMIRSLKGLALMQKKGKILWMQQSEAIREFLKAYLLYQSSGSHIGQGLCSFAIGHIMSDKVINFIEKKADLLKYAQKKFIESLFHYQKVKYFKGMSTCYQMIYAIKLQLGEDAKMECDNYLYCLSLHEQDIEDGSSNITQ